jgi:DNA-binding NarL/FixJ family response regulator
VLYGRDVERDEIGALLTAARASRSGVLVIRGEAGIGKTSLLQDARERADHMHVLSVRGVEAESELPFAALHQLLRPALDRLDDLPPPQAGALRSALGLGDRSGDDRFLVSLAVLTLLAELAERRPVLCLIDDAQWLDTASADAMLFVSRRLDAEGIVMLFAAREGDERRFDGQGLRELILTGLDSAAAGMLASGRGGEIAPSVRDTLVHRAGGNPLALVELRAMLTHAQLSGSEPLPDAIPLTPDIERLFLARTRRLGADTQRLLLLVAADDSGLLSPILRAAAALGVAAEALDPAEAAGLVVVRGDRIDVRHPLLRSAIYQGASSTDRREAHLALAQAFEGEVEADRHAWHRGAAVLGPDSDVADELERTAERARLRSGHSSAASALERASELSGDDASRGRRLAAAAGAAWQSGQPDRALALLDRAAPIVTDPLVKADLAHIRGGIGLRRGSLLDAGAVLIAGADEVAPLDPHKALEMLVDAGAVAGRSGDIERMIEVGSKIASLPRSGDPGEQLLADLVVGVSEIIGGKSSTATAVVQQSIGLALDSDDPRLLSWALIGASTLDDHATEAALLARALAVSRASGAVDTVVLVLEAVVAADIGGGRYAAEAEAAEGLRLAREVGLPNAVTAHLGALAFMAALKGREEECRDYATAVARAAATSGVANANSFAQWGVAMLDLSLGRPEATISRLDALSDAPVGLAQPLFVLMSSPELIEACVRTGRREQAERAFALLDGFARSGASAWAQAYAARCRALLADEDTAEQAYEEALELHARTRRLFDTARTQLLFGEFLRRAHRRIDSREQLRSALDTFERLGAELWVERARGELRASGETTRKRDPSAMDQLTPQELQVARYVADGLSNKEVAAQLFLSPRTIDYHLRKVFLKLGITSRTQLARVGLDAQTGSSDAVAAQASA